MGTLHRDEGVGHLGDEDHEQKDMRDIELPHAAIDLRRGEKRAVAVQALAIDQCRGVARDEDEHLGRVAERDRVEGEVGQHVLGNMVDEDEEQRQAAKEIEPEVAARGGGRGSRGGAARLGGGRRIDHRLFRHFAAS